MGDIKKINYIFDKRQKINFIILFVLICISAILESFGVTILIPFIGAILDSDELFQNSLLKPFIFLFDIQDGKQLVLFLTVVVMFVYVVKNIFLLFSNRMQYRFIFNNQRRLSYRMLKSYLNESYLFHTIHNSAELRNNILMDVDTFFATILNILLLMTEVMISGSLIIVMFVVDKTMTLGITLLVGGVLLLFARLYKDKIRQFGEARRKNAIGMEKCIDQTLGGIKEIKILNCETYFLDSFGKTHGEYIQSRKRYSFYSTAPKPVLEALCIVALLGVVIIKIFKGVGLEYFLVSLSVFAGSALKILPSVSKMASYASMIMFNKASIDAVYKDLKEIEVRQEENNNKLSEIGSKKITFEKGIEIQNLYFGYPNTEKYVLENINLFIPKNKSIAFVGPSGAGKTTLADIILGVLQPEKGKVLVDGCDVNCALSSWQQQLGYIPQNIYLMDDSIRNNIAFGIDENVVDDSKIWKALEGAQLKEFVESLEDGLDTVIGERGTRLSGGQRQRIGIARALYRNSEVLVLDEATSALDNDTEKAVMEAIEALSGSKTLIIIAHRLSTIENCDIVFEIKDGCAKKVRGE